MLATVALGRGFAAAAAAGRSFASDDRADLKTFAYNLGRRIDSLSSAKHTDYAPIHMNGFFFVI